MRLTPFPYGSTPGKMNGDYPNEFPAPSLPGRAQGIAFTVLRTYPRR
jgi:hypothetical protein